MAVHFEEEEEEEEEEEVLSAEARPAPHLRANMSHHPWLPRLHEM